MRFFYGVTLGLETIPERIAYLQAGAFVLEAVIENPQVVKRLQEDFLHAGSDVEAFTYYAHRQKLKVVGREDILGDIGPALRSRSKSQKVALASKTNVR